MIDISDLQTTIESCLEQMTQASISKYDSEKADKTAALFLIAQMKLSALIEDIELKAKQSKNEISRLEGEKYFEFKINGNDKKITENMMSSYLAKEPDIVNAKNENAQHEANLKKYNYIMSTLKDGHVYFRNIGKNKNWAE